MQPLSAKHKLKSATQKAEFRKQLMGLTGLMWEAQPEQYCDYRVDARRGGGWVRVKQYTNGTLFIQASQAALLNQVTALLQPGTRVATPDKASSPGASSGNASMTLEGAYIGTDESGKGDYFGPLVVAGVFVTEATRAELDAAGVMDSKALSAQRIHSIAATIREIVGEQAISVVTFKPSDYNALYASYQTSGKNLNHLLGWGHATAIESLLETNPTCTQAMADQFGNERYIQSQLQEKGQKIKLYQQPRAEAHTGVAAASILARECFVNTLRELGDSFEMTLPPGANPRVKTAARHLIASHGRNALNEVAKLHFKTTQEL